MPTLRKTVGAFGLLFATATGCSAQTATPGFRTAGELAPLGPNLLAPEAGAGVVSNHGASLIANNSGSLRGTVVGPSAALLNSHASGIISDNVGSLVSNNAANLIGNNAAGFVGHADGLGSGGYGLLALSTFEPATQARVAVFDEHGTQVSTGWTSVDAQGTYQVDALTASSPVLFVRAAYTLAGVEVTLQAIAPAPREVGVRQVAVSPVTSLVAKKVDAMLAKQVLKPGALDPLSLTDFTRQVAAVLPDRLAVAAAVLPPERAANVFDGLVATTPSLGQALAGVRGAEALTDHTSARAPGQVSTLAGGAAAGFKDGTGPDAQFNYPYGVAVGTSGLIFVSDFKNHCIRQVTPEGTVTTLAGNGQAGYADGAGAQARFNGPRGLAVDAQGVVYVVDGANARIRRVAPDGTVTTLAGTGVAGFADGPAATAQFDDPRGIALDSRHNVYVADTGNLRVRKLSAAGEVSTFLQMAAPEPTGTARLQGPYGLAVGVQDTLYVADASANAVLAVTPDGHARVFLGGAEGFASGNGTAARFKGPVGLAVADDGRLFVADFFNHSVRVADPSGAVSTLAGTGEAGLADAAGSSAKFFGPYGVAVGPDGYLYVADTSNQRLRRVSLR